VKLPTEPPDKGLRYVIVVSTDAQNHHPRATTVLVVPLSTTISSADRLRFSPGETGLKEHSEVWANGITAIRKDALRPPREQLRKLGHGAICQIAKHVIRTMAVLPVEITG
jgi:mRNA-degrading endonuclease toxin of MazEF toxin-antitoxin module